MNFFLFLKIFKNEESSVGGGEIHGLFWTEPQITIHTEAW